MKRQIVFSEYLAMISNQSTKNFFENSMNIAEEESLSCNFGVTQYSPVKRNLKALAEESRENLCNSRLL